MRQKRHQRNREAHAKNLFEQLHGDATVPDYVLYLRPFSTTGRLAVANPKRRWLPLLPGYYKQQPTLEFETLLSESLPPGLPLIALGRPARARYVPRLDKARPRNALVGITLVNRKLPTQSRPQDRHRDIPGGRP